MLYIEERFGKSLTVACKVVLNWIEENNLVDAYNEFASKRENDLLPICVSLDKFYQAHETEANAIPFC